MVGKWQFAFLFLVSCPAILEGDKLSVDLCAALLAQQSWEKFYGLLIACVEGRSGKEQLFGFCLFSLS